MEHLNEELIFSHELNNTEELRAYRDKIKFAQLNSHKLIAPPISLEVHAIWISPPKGSSRHSDALILAAPKDDSLSSAANEPLKVFKATLDTTLITRRPLWELLLFESSQHPKCCLKKPQFALNKYQHFAQVTRLHTPSDTWKKPLPDFQSKYPNNIAEQPIGHMDLTLMGYLYLYQHHYVMYALWGDKKANPIGWEISHKVTQPTIINAYNDYGCFFAGPKSTDIIDLKEPAKSSISKINTAIARAFITPPALSL